MKIKVLGTGKQLKSSCLVQTDQGSLLIDINKDTLFKVSKETLLNLSAILLTHGHRDSINGIPLLNGLFKKSSKPLRIYAHVQAIKQLKLRYDSSDLNELQFIELDSAKVYDVAGHKVQPVLVEHDKNYPTFGFSINNEFFYAPDMSPSFNSKYMKDNSLIILDGARCYQDSKRINHVDIVKDIDKILKLNNKLTLFLSPDNTLEADACINKFLKEKGGSMRLAQEGETLSIDSKELGTEKYTAVSKVPDLIDTSRTYIIQKGVDYSKEYVLSKKISKLLFKGALYLVEPTIEGKAGIVVDKKRKIVYERVVTPKGQEVMTDLLAHKDYNLAESSLLSRLVYTDKNWNSLLVPRYLPRRRVATKSNLTKVLKYYQRFEQVLIRPLSSKYSDGKFIIKFNITKVIGRTTSDRKHYHRFSVEHEHGMGQTGQRIGKGPLHKHKIKGWTVQKTQGHTHDLVPDKSKGTIFKPAPDVTINFIRWRIRNPNLFVKDSFRTIHISKKQKIQAIIGKLKSDPDGPTHIQSVLFAKKKWTVAKARAWIKSHRHQLKSLKADDLGQLETPGGDPMPRPVSSLKTYRCTKCEFEFQSNKKETKCPMCGSKLVRVNNKESGMKKDINLPADKSRPTLLDRVLLRVLGTDVLKQTSIETPIPFYKVAIYSQAINKALLGKETKVIGLKWGEMYVPAAYEELEVKRDTKERLLVSGYICVKDEVPLVVHFGPGWECQWLTIYSRKSQVEKASELLKNIQSFVKHNNPWKNEKVTPFGRFLPLSSINLSKVILDPDIKKRLDKTVLRFFDSKDKFTAANIPFKRGVIFSGVPGTGKTLSGRVIMNSIKDVTFIWVTARDFKNLSTSYLFDMARELQPVVLFIEDVDRCLTGSTLDAIKTQMDGLESNEGILTILSTNFPEQLPKTLIDRPGRFDDVIEFTMPSTILRFKVLWLYSQNIGIKDKKHTLATIAKLSEGLTPAHLKEVIVSAYVANETSEVTFEDLKSSLDHLKELHDRFNFKKSVIDTDGYKSILQKIKEWAIQKKASKGRTKKSE